MSFGIPVARLRKHKGTVKMHTLLELRGNIPSFIRIPDAKVHDVNISMLPALTIARMYKQRWQVELFFRLVKMLCKRDVLAVLIGVAVL